MARYYLKYNLYALLLNALALGSIVMSSVDALISYTLYNSKQAAILFIILSAAANLIGIFKEGWCFFIVPSVLTILFLLFAYCFNHWIFISICLILIFLHFYLIEFLPIYRFPRPTGKFSAGYKDVKDAGNLYSIYYPTNSPNNNRPRWMPDEACRRKYHELVSGEDRSFPRWLFELLTGFFKSVPINASVDAKIASNAANKFIPIFFSHGLGASRNNYSTLFTELASRGYLVFTFEHFDGIYEVLYEKGDKSDERAYSDLRQRQEQIQSIITKLMEPDFLACLFGEKISVDFTRLVGIGHSFGGAAHYIFATSGKCNLSDIIFLDAGFKKEGTDYLQAKLDSNLLIIESDSWNTKNPIMQPTLKNRAIFNSQKGNGKVTIYSKVTGSDHVSFLDDVLLLGKPFAIKNVLSKLEHAEPLLLHHVQMVVNYLEIFVKGSADRTVQAQAENFRKLYEKDDKTYLEFQELTEKK